MKEATGELNMTVITVVAIAAVAAFFYAFVWPSIKSTITSNTKCASVAACTCGETDSGTNSKTCTCSYYDDSGEIADDTVTCTFQDS